jgi:hypothetical protein
MTVLVPLFNLTEQSISYGTRHTSEIQIVKNQYVRNAGFAYCVLSHVPSCWPYIGHSRVSSMAPSCTGLPAIQAWTPPAPCDGGIRRRPRSRPCIGLAFEVIRQLARVLFRIR